MLLEESIIKNKKGEIKVNENEITERWREFSRQILNELSEYQLDKMAKVKGPLKGITEEEVKAALNGMKKWKVAGLTRVTIDLLQATGMAGLR